MLVAQAPLHVGGIGGDEDADLALATDGQGRLYIPGTSLAGALRGWLERHVDPEDEKTLRKLWGYQPKEATADDQGQASRVLIEDAVISSEVIAEVRDGVGIDRGTGAAAHRVKYDRAVLPRGTEIPLHITVEVAPDDDPKVFPALIGMVLAELCAGRIRLGAAKTRGLGAVQLTEPKIRRQTLNTPEGILAVLADGGEKEDWTTIAATVTPSTRGCRLDITVDWEPVGPVMVKASHDGAAAGMLPLTSAADEEGRLSFVLPGSAIKGALRSQAERIVRTVCPDLQPTLPEKYLEQIDLPLITSLFGTCGKRDESSTDENDRTPLSGLGAFAVEDCFARDARFSREQWRSVENAPDDPALRAALDVAQLQTVQHAYHVAVDRWTGGAADGQLYTVLEPHAIAWEPLRFSLDFTRLPDDEREPALALLLLVLRDLADGRLPLGYGVNRGMGAVKVTGITLDGQGMDKLDPPLDEHYELTLTGIEDLSADLCTTLGKIGEKWNAWIVNTASAAMAGLR